MTLIITAALALGTPLTASPTPGTTCTAPGLLSAYSVNYHAVRREHGRRAPGRNIRRDGLRSGRRARCRDVARSLRVLRGMRYRGARLLSAGPPRRAPAGTATLRASGAPLAAIRACESGGDYAADTGNGFHGAYQFTQGTWESVGGTGNPAAASPAEQDRRAAMLYARRGAQPWPTCGR